MTYHYSSPSLLTEGSFIQYILSNYQNQDIFKGKNIDKCKTCMRQKMHQNQTPEWQWCWNYQTRNLFFFLVWIFFFSFIFISWRLINLQYCCGFCHTLTWISHGFTCTPHPDSPSHLPLYPIPLGLPSAPGPCTCLMHPTWAGDLFHPR